MDEESTMGLEPFDPQKHKPTDVGHGGPSTELLTTVDGPDGKVWNVPSLWWTKEGKPLVLDPSQAIQVADEYEKITGKRFPRFGDVNDAVNWAKRRSKKGGATYVPLAQ